MSEHDRSSNILARKRNAKRLDRQFDALSRQFPRLRRPINMMRARGWWILRLPLGLLFVAGGFLAILPVFGLWMIPLGLMLLAVDLPLLRGPLSRLMIRARRRYELWQRRR